jgi:pyrimidine operon attenuation protein/uracil phosphoribosyltransferase
MPSSFCSSPQVVERWAHDCWLEFVERKVDCSLAIAHLRAVRCLESTSPQLAPGRQRLVSSGEREFMSEEPSQPSLRIKGRLMSASEIERTLVRLAHQIVEKSNGSGDLALIGIKRRGVPLAERLGKLIAGIEKRPVDTGVLDIQFYRDDLSTAGPRPVVTPGAIGFDVAGRDVVLCDDVLYTGRTIRAALDALFDHGRPRRVQLAVLIDRGHRELPIEATYVGKTVPTSSREIIEVKFREVDQDEQVLLVERVD